MKLIEPHVKIIDYNRMLKNIERGGRLCYKSEDKMGEGTDEIFCEKLKSYKHFCYDAETEVLCSSGWKKWQEVTLEDSFATINTEGFLEYHKAIRLYSNYYEGDMYKVTSGQVDLLVTPNHRMYVCPTTTLQGRKGLNFKFIEAQDLNKTSCKYTKVAKYISNSSVGLQYAEAQLLGFLIGDGWVESNRIAFNLVKRRKVDYLYSICGILNIPIQSDYTRDCKYTIPITNPIFHKIYSDSGKSIPFSIPDYSTKELEGILDGLINSDGSIEKNGTRFDNTSKVLVDQVQQILLHLEKCGNIHKGNQNEKNSKHKDLYTIHILQRAQKPHINKLKRDNQTSWEKYKGNIYCAEVPNGTLYVRRNGYPVWCGNSVYEHASITVQVLTDRGVTHEVVRHRLAAFSQESTRYCNYSKDKYGNEITVLNPFFFDPAEPTQKVELPSTIHYPFTSGVGTLSDHPTELAGHRLVNLNSFDVWMISCLWSEWGYNTLTQVFKRSAQEARSILPNSLKTEIQITMNAREWLHVFSCRVPKDAHPQMRQIMVPLAKEFAKKWPVIFGEYKDLVLPPKSSTIEWEV